MLEHGQITGFHAWWQPGKPQISREYTKTYLQTQKLEQITQKTTQNTPKWHQNQTARQRKEYVPIGWINAWLDNTEIKNLFANWHSLQAWANNYGYRTKDTQAIIDHRKQQMRKQSKKI